MGPKILIASDFHVGATGRHRHHRDDIRESFNAVVDAAISEEVSYFVCAGDGLDRPSRIANPDLLFLSHQIQRLCNAGIRIWWVLGNHDQSPSYPLMEIFTPFIQLITRGNYMKSSHIELRPTLDMIALPYLLKGDELPIIEKGANTYRIGVSHQAIEGVADNSNIAMQRIQETEFVLTANHLHSMGINMLFSGHLHRHMEYELETIKVYFPGSTTIMNFGEVDSGNGFYIIDLTALEIEYRELPQRKWFNLNYLPKTIEEDSVYKIVIPEDIALRASDIKLEFSKHNSEVFPVVERHAKEREERISGLRDMDDENRISAWLRMRGIEDVTPYIEEHRRITS